MLNSALNAVIALIEDRPAQFKQMLRSAASDVKNIPEVQARLQKALRKYAATQIRVGLMATLHVDPDEAPWKVSEDEKVSFFNGVRCTEAIFEKLAQELEQ